MIIGVPILKKNLRFLLFFLIPLYRGLFLLHRYFKKREKLPVRRVWSIGNLSVGGTGKTPFILTLLGMARSLGLESIVVLSRGYGGSLSRKGGEVSVHSHPNEVGDEPLMIKKNFPEVRVLIGQNRYQTFLNFVSKPDSIQLVLLDDGFQHHALERDLDFVLIDTSKAPERFLLPVGNLRESYSALNRADYLVFSKFNLGQKAYDLELESEFRRRFPNLRYLRFGLQPQEIKNREGESIDMENCKKFSVFFFSGIGNPKTFFSHTERYFLKKIGEKVFLDHHKFTESDMMNLSRESKNSDILLCTEKDFVKCRELKDLPKNLFYLSSEGEITPGEVLREEMKDLLRNGL